MKKKSAFSIALIFLVGVMARSPVWAGGPESDAEGAKVRVGTFDSRAVAMAYYRSKVHSEHIRGMMAEYKAAKDAGDEELASKLQAEGEASQELAHKQGFGTYPVDEILAKVEERIPEIAARAGVDIIVSKWDLVHQRPGIDFVDVTLLMVAPFEPDEATLKMIQEELPKHAPVPVAELEAHKH